MTNECITIFKGDTSRLRNTIPMTERLAPEFFDEEVKKIFSKSWLIIGTSKELVEKGSYIVTDVPPLKASLIIVRGEDEKIRVFRNICRHRGDKLVHGKEGCSKFFQCQFHAWTFSNTGNLIGVTDATQFKDMKKDELGLIEIHSEVWEDIVFVNFEEHPAHTLKEWLGDIYGQYKGFSDNRVKVADHRVVVNTNWNLAVNAFCEGYHNIFIHKNTVPDYQGSPSNPNRHRPYLEVGKHFGRYSAHGNPNHKPTPAEGIFYKYSRPMFPSFVQFEMDKLPIGVNPSRFEQWAFDIVHLFPNIVIGPQANTNSIMLFWPISHNKTDIRVMRFSYKTDKPSDRIAQAHSLVRNREVLREDLATMETQYESIASGGLPYMFLSEQEQLIQNHYRAADDMLNEGV
jgi:Rieske 2Fe-2S family protein